MSLATILTQVCRRIGITAPTAFTASQDPQIQQLIGLANEEGQELSARYPWGSLQVERTFTSVAAETQGTVLALAGADFRYILNDIMWDRSLLRPVFGPLSPQRWQELKARSITGPFAQYRIRGGNVLFIPSPAAGDTIAFEYLSKNWITPATLGSWISTSTGETYTPHGSVTISGSTRPQYFTLSGTAGSYFSTPSAAANQIAGDIDIICYAAANDWTDPTFPTLAGKFLATGNQRAWGLVYNATGNLILTTYSLGTAASGVSGTSTVAPTVADGSGIWLRATLDVDDGSGNRVYKFYYSNDSSSVAPGSVSWTQLGATVTTAGTTSIFASTALLEIGSNSNGAFQNFSGKIYIANVYNGIGGTLAVSFNANDASGTANAWVSDTDVGLIDEEIMAFGVIWRWKQVKGLGYAEDFNKYEGLITDQMARDGGKPLLNLNGDGGSYPAGTIVPIGSWHV